eukprot:3981372-Pyramimonas_sp.AAC.1
MKFTLDRVWAIPARYLHSIVLHKENHPSYVHIPSGCTAGRARVRRGRRRSGRKAAEWRPRPARGERLRLGGGPSNCGGRPMVAPPLLVKENGSGAYIMT